MADAAMAKSWPSGIDKGAELQFSLLEYCQPPARESSKSSQDTDQGGQASSPQTLGEGDKTDTKKTEEQDDSEGWTETSEDPETVTVAEKPSTDGGNQSKDKSDNQENTSLDPLVDPPKEYYESPDLKVVIKGEPDKVAFLVSSHALAIASKEWRNKLSRDNLKELESHPFDGSSDGTIKVLCLEDVDPSSLDILFQVIHWKTDDLPQHLTFDALRKLALTCEKYGCGRVLNPWPLVWMEEYEQQAVLPGFEDWMFIAQALDTRNVKLREVSRQMILEVSSISKCGTYLRRDVRGEGIAAHTIEIEVKLIPPGILEYILEERTKAVDQVICLLRQFVSDITGANPGSYGLTEEFCRSETCSDIASGSLLRNLKALNLWPLLRSGVPQEWHGSVTTLVMQVEAIRMTTFLKFGAVGEPATEVANEASPEPEIKAPKPKNPLKHQPKQNNIVISKREAARSSPGPSAKDSSISKPQPQAAPTESPAQNKPNTEVPLFSTSETGEIAFNLYDNKAWESPLFGGMLYSNVMDDRWAAAMKELRYEHPAFEATYRFRGSYRPCPSAFALGELITECRRIVTDISVGGYQPGL
ncbi:hypothetical protein TWF506_007152 [Arthrobotrys conoides]|uniref:BTB domain-containing protein n=1 Tax=Arthrobotrys conoides TaxID=74498 RepID=A0AAN8NA33_9PEZI